ncbi:hypothetical protein BS50DRAFT_398739 [Corynespora cassiicola Philippines]|uniref:Uncharacterized protein n=1 Tax=Corynespora cassiicola Philippines TaxID=1448308 RepID=A0A2T2NK76_CORCC|nr:hypothetical protein BS50DRAFT_398739 [Corynespora cassiicola Philippines]
MRARYVTANRKRIAYVISFPSISCGGAGTAECRGNFGGGAQSDAVDRWARKRLRARRPTCQDMDGDVPVAGRVADGTLGVVHRIRGHAVGLTEAQGNAVAGCLDPGNSQSAGGPGSERGCLARADLSRHPKQPSALVCAVAFRPAITPTS